MRRSHRLLALSTLAVPALVAGLVIPSAAYAKGPKTPKPVRVTCTHLSGNVTGVPTPPTLSGCTPTLQTGGSGTFPGSSLGQSGHVTVTWNGTGTTTFSYTTTIPKGDKCPADPSSPGNKQTEAILHGHITGNTETDPTTDGGVKAAVTAKICVTSSLDLSLLPPKPFKL